MSMDMSNNTMKYDRTGRIYGLASLLVDVTTDYAYKELVEFGLSAASIKRCQAIARPWIEGYGRYFSGISHRELIKLEIEIIKDLRSNNLDDCAFFCFLLELSDGRDRLLWPSQLAMTDFVEMVKWREYDSSSDQSHDLWQKLGSNVQKNFSLPLAQFEERQEVAEVAWKARKTSPWDETVRTLIYDNLQVYPGVRHMIKNKLIRDMSKFIRDEFSDSQFNHIQREIKTYFTHTKIPGLRGSDVDSALNFQIILKETHDEEREIRTSLKKIS